MSLTLIGTVPYRIPFGSPIHNHVVVYPLHFDSEWVNWPADVLNLIPVQFNGVFSDVKNYLDQNNNVYTYDYSYNFIITGSQGSPGGTAVTDMIFCDSNCTAQYTNQDKSFNDNQQFRLEADDDIYNVNTTLDRNYPKMIYGGTDFSTTYPTYVAIYPHTYCSGAGCHSDEPINYAVTISLLLNISANCNAENMGELVCQNYMQALIGQNHGPLVAVDTVLDWSSGGYCKKFSGMQDLLATGSLAEQNLCACHLDPQQYINYRDSLAANFSAAGLIIGQMNDHCLFPTCASSSFPSSLTGEAGTGTCTLPLCVNIFDIGDNGSFNVQGGNVKVDQSSDCTNVSPKGTPTTPGGDSKTIIIIVVIIVIIIILVVGGYFVFKG